MQRIMDIVAEETGGKSFNSIKYRYDSVNAPKADYDDPFDNREWLGNGETKLQKEPVDCLAMAKQLSENNIEPIFKYFLDGSRHAYHVDDIAYNHNVFPVIAGQAGVACCRRENRKLRLEHFSSGEPTMINHTVLSMPKDCDQDGHHTDAYLEKLKNKINASPTLARLEINIAKVLVYKTDRTVDAKFEDRGIAAVQDYMSDAEKGMVDRLAKAGMLSQNAYLVKDGSLEYIPLLSGNYRDIWNFRESYRWVVGVSKKFNPEHCRDKNNKPNADKLIDLLEGYRTPVMLFKNSRIDRLLFAVWYLRLRGIDKTRNPFDGVVKVEKILLNDDADSPKKLETEDVDMITATLLNERNPACYGSDLRYANHIYPVYLTESFIKSNYMSDELLIQMF
ncbi:MAG: hypothetical protein LBK66_13555 [Spirochaetaceae bacterium]|nr:hypothetical protein [Spirochaetaceae bacterium]